MCAGIDVLMGSDPRGERVYPDVVIAKDMGE